MKVDRMSRQISFKLPGYWVVFKEVEVMTMLKAFPVIWEEAIKRGKPLSRAEKELSRKAK